MYKVRSSVNWKQIVQTLRMLCRKCYEKPRRQTTRVCYLRLYRTSLELNARMYFVTGGVMQKERRCEYLAGMRSCCMTLLAYPRTTLTISHAIVVSSLNDMALTRRCRSSEL